MFTVTTGKNIKHKIDFTDRSTCTGKFNDVDFELDLVEFNNNCFHIIKDNKSYSVEVVKANFDEKKFVIRVNGNDYHLEVKDRFDELLHSLGFDKLSDSKINEIKAPMPGRVIDIKVKEGEKVKKGCPVIVLEAMKMENILKSPGNGTVKKLNVKKGVTVEKNEVLIIFE